MIWLPSNAQALDSSSVTSTHVEDLVLGCCLWLDPPPATVDIREGGQQIENTSLFVSLSLSVVLPFKYK